MPYRTVRATRDFGEREASAECTRCGVPVSEVGVRCRDCYAIEFPLSARALRKLRKEEREHPEAVAAFNAGLVA